MRGGHMFQIVSLDISVELGTDHVWQLLYGAIFVAVM